MDFQLIIFSPSAILIIFSLKSFAFSLQTLAKFEAAINRKWRWIFAFDRYVCCNKPPACVLGIPYILSGRLTKRAKIESGLNYITAAHAEFVTEMLRLGFRAPLVARNKERYSRW